MSDESLAKYWNDRASEDPFFFVDNRLEYGKPDLDRFWEEGRRDLDTLLDVAGVALEPDDAVVEIGCGVGRLTRVIAERAASVTALDVSERMLDTARAHNPDATNVTWVQGDGSSLAGVTSASADAVVSHVVFQHLPSASLTLGYVREIGRVLRPGGWAAFQVSNDPAVHQRRPLGFRIKSAARAVLRRGPRGIGDPRWLGSSVRLAELRATAAAAGMQTERVVGEGTQFCVVRMRRT